jgi:hypothetical protein
VNLSFFLKELADANGRLWLEEDRLLIEAGDDLETEDLINRAGQHKVELREYLADRPWLLEEKRNLCQVQPGEQGPFPLSFAQQRFWLNRSTRESGFASWYYERMPHSRIVTTSIKEFFREPTMGAAAAKLLSKNAPEQSI